MVSEVESAHSKKWEVGSAELKPNGLGFARTSAKPPSLDPPRLLRHLKRKRFHRRRAQTTLLAIRARYHLQIWRKYLKILSLRFYLALMDR